MENDQFDDDVQDNQRSIVIGAVLLAILVAAVLWYAVIFRGDDAPEDQFIESGVAVDVAQDLEPALDKQPDATTEPVEQVPISSPLGEAPSLMENGTIAGIHDGKGIAEPTPIEPAPVTSETGAGTFFAAAALAATFGGVFGLKRIRTLR